MVFGNYDALTITTLSRSLLSISSPAGDKNASVNLPPELARLRAGLGEDSSLYSDPIDLYLRILLRSLACIFTARLLFLPAFLRGYFHRDVEVPVVICWESSISAMSSFTLPLLFNSTLKSGSFMLNSS